MVFFLYLGLGLISGFLSGLLGLGGGIILVPALYWIFTELGFAPAQLMSLSIATTLGAMGVISSYSITAHYRLGSIALEYLKPLVPLLCLGTMLGAYLSQVISSLTLQLLFSLVMCLIGTQLLLFPILPSTTLVLNRWGWRGIGLFIGSLAGLLGLGGGIILMPVLLYTGLPLATASGTTAGSTFVVSLVGAMTYVYLGWSTEALPAYCLGYLYLPAILGISLASLLSAPLGASCSHRWPTWLLKRLLGSLLLWVAWKMWAQL
jgi:uncharacterized membrane protein YfcA